MNRDEINPTTIAGLDFDAVRVTDEGYPHYIELRQRGSGETFARINYYGPGTEMRLVTGDVPVPRTVVEGLLAMADEALTIRVTSA